ncbi:MAG: hypothetical protein HQK83_20570 [Fibrobacteria bacterium]|nr:hypothetical protein [Fibrobacteria bacterium]
MSGYPHVDMWKEFKKKAAQSGASGVEHEPPFKLMNMFYSGIVKLNNNCGRVHIHQSVGEQSGSKVCA